MRPENEIRLLLAGDVMLGRGVDQVLPHPGDPRLYEPEHGLRDAGILVQIAQLKNGPIPAARDVGYVWGEALEEMAALRPDLRLVNLETAITARGTPWPNKRFHFRMHPANVGVLAAAGIDFCALANNHTLDWGAEGMLDTIDALEGAGIAHAGAGRDQRAAAAPALLPVPGKGRVIVVAAAMKSSGVPVTWRAGPETPGLNLVGVNEPWLDILRRRIEAVRQPGDIVVLSIHWGDNYGPAFAPDLRAFARRLIDEVGVHLVHGHSSHHVQGIEVHNGRPILYGCGDLVNDYEAVLRRVGRLMLDPELGLLYLARISLADGRLLGLEMRPTRLRRLQVCRGGPEAAARLARVMNRFGETYGTRVEVVDGTLHLRWDDA